MDGAITIEAILEKRVFKGTSSKNQKSGVGISSTGSVDELASLIYTKSRPRG